MFAAPGLSRHRNAAASRSPVDHLWICCLSVASVSEQTQLGSRCFLGAQTNVALFYLLS